MSLYKTKKRASYRRPSVSVSKKRVRRRSSRDVRFLSIRSYWAEAGMVILFLAMLSPTFLAGIVDRIPATNKNESQNFYSANPAMEPLEGYLFPRSAQSTHSTTSNSWGFPSVPTDREMR